MNCNTTHYRANSSSVPGDPTHFALANPGLFRLIFSAAPEPGDPFSRPAEEMPEAFRMLWDNAARLAPPDAGPQAAPLIALEAWALVHGLAILILDGQIPRNDALIDAILAKPPGC